MEPVPPPENTRRGTTKGERICKNGHVTGPGSCVACRKETQARHRAKIESGEHIPTRTKTHCVNGHDKNGEAQCRECMKAASARHYAAKKS